MICLDTGSTVLRVNQSLVRQDQDAWHDVLVPLDENPVSGYVDPDWFKGKDTRCDVLELYTCSARTSEAAASASELVVATPVDLTQPEATSAAWTSLNAARPKVVVVVPRSRPWRKQQPGEEKWQVAKRRRKAEEELNLCADIAEHQRSQDSHFVFLHPYCSSLWEQARVQELLSHPGVHWDNVNMAEETYIILSNLPAQSVRCLLSYSDQVKTPASLEENLCPGICPTHW